MNRNALLELRRELEVEYREKLAAIDLLLGNKPAPNPVKSQPRFYGGGVAVPLSNTQKPVNKNAAVVDFVNRVVTDNNQFSALTIQTYMRDHYAMEASIKQISNSLRKLKKKGIIDVAQQGSGTQMSTYVKKQKASPALKNSGRG